MSVEGMSKSSIARVQRIGWNTVDRWLARAAAFYGRYNHRMIHRPRIVKFQADESRTIAKSAEVAPKPLVDQNYGAGDGDRTRDVQLGKLAFYR